MGYEDIQIDAFFSELGFREFIRSEPHVLPRFSGEESALGGEKFTNYLQYLEMQTPPEYWGQRELDLKSSMERVLPYLFFDRPIYGLVIGDVQSGKTSNFLGLTAAAIDNNVNLIIILSGTTNLLRNQTQIRFEQAFGTNDPFFLCLTQKDVKENKVSPEHGPYVEWQSGDFKSTDLNLDKEISKGRTIIAILKKTKPTLENFVDYLRLFPGLNNKKVLIIDDESDSASINTVRPPEEDDDEAGVEEENDEETATAINILIRRIIQVSNYSVYLGYTATPYAALLSNPFENDAEYGPSLYPRDVILTLPTPMPHCGVSEYFSPHGYLRRRVSVIQDDGGETLSQLEPEELPESLKNSILDFIISGALKLINKGNKNFHHTMLVHNHIRTINHNIIAQKIQRFGANFSTKYSRVIFSNRQPEYYDLKSRWENEFLIEELRENEMDTAIKEFLVKFRWTSMVKTINSSKESVDRLFSTDSRLDYSTPGKWVIAVGGTILSRGLTVEGLSISYFSRRSALYDSLTQMARWCGYHSTFDQQLIRVRTTPLILEWFQWIYRVDTQIRLDVAVLEERGGSPVELSPRILFYNHEELDFLPTRRGAMQYAVLRGNSFSGTSPSTLHLDLDNQIAQSSNIALLNELVEGLDDWEPMEFAGGQKTNIDYERVMRFAESFQLPNTRNAMDIRGILNYISERREEGELTNWTICLYSPTRNRASNIDWRGTTVPPPNVTERGKMPQGRLDVLFDKRHTAEDIAEFIEDRTRITRQSARTARPLANAQLGIYILSSDYTPPDGARGFTGLYSDNTEHTDVVAFGFVFPDSDVDAEEYWMAEGLMPVDESD